MAKSTRTRVALIGLLLLVPTVLVACGGERRAERQGKQFGDAVCDVRESDSVDEAERQLRQAERQAEDLYRIVGRRINEDVEDIEENLSDLLEHVRDQQDLLLDQDIAVIQRNIQAVQKTVSGRAEAAYDGVQQGLADCNY
jgi:peptidoglycan hydrolase CwlO-like protein